MAQTKKKTGKVYYEDANGLTDTSFEQKLKDLEKQMANKKVD